MNEQLVFGLDIGTRSIVGSVGYLDRDKFKIVAHYVKEHETRAMMDGQIHDIAQVSDSIAIVRKELENIVGYELKDVCIAAAGRVLKTKTVRIDYEMTDETLITGEHIYALDLLGVEKAHESIRNEESQRFYCVGYSVIKYYLNDYVITNLEGHKGRKISADVLATFLPEEVVDGLYTAVNNAKLEVANLTLEPIAAINIAIPENYRLLNIALVDVGAGTSDISITRDGSIVAYGMIPRAGDEITESIAGRYLIDFNLAEKIKMDSAKKKSVTFKDIMGLKQKVLSEDIRASYGTTVDSITKEISDKITELNGGKPVSAVFVVGGGGKAEGFIEGIARHLNIPSERVALRGAEVLGAVDFLQEGIKKDPLLVTPIGICLNYYNQKNNFILVNINEQHIKMYDNSKLTVLDAAMQIDFPNESLFPKRGKELNYYVNDNKRMLRGEMGEPAVITVNGETANINTPISKNDKIVIKESTTGPAASLRVEQIPEYKSELKVIVNDKMVNCPRFVEVNGSLVSGTCRIRDNDRIKILDYYSVAQLVEFLDIDIEDKEIYLNNVIANLNDSVYENFTIKIEDKFAEEESYGYEEEYEDEFYEEEEVTVKAPVSTNIKSESVKNAPPPAPAKEEANSLIVINVNGKTLILNSKKKYLFVDILDVYPFDMSLAGKKQLVMTINGVGCTFADELSDGDIIELCWR
ncbi:MAG: cell division protein FtsA [Lachnospiraceae bacterium]|nr:cell division protein FtsA [Lachnospiraceae bacterium]